MMMCARLARSASKALKNSSCVRSLPAKNWTSSMCGRPRHLVGAAGNERVESKRRIEPAARRHRCHRRAARHRPAGAYHRNAVGAGGALLARVAVHALARARQCPRRCFCEDAALADNRCDRGGRFTGAPGAVALRERDVEPHGLAGKFAQHCLDPARILMANPVELEPVRHAHRDDGGLAVVGHVGVRKRPDPGVELLVRQLGRKAFAAALPEIGSHVWRSGR
jgi:hypothetical protein